MFLKFNKKCDTQNWKTILTKLFQIFKHLYKKNLEFVVFTTLDLKTTQ